MCIPPPPPLCIPRLGHVYPPPQPERLVMRKDEAVGNKKKMQVCLPKHNYKLDNNLLTVEPRAVDPHCFDADPDPDPAQNLDADPDPDPGERGLGQTKMCIPPVKIQGTPLPVPVAVNDLRYVWSREEKILLLPKKKKAQDQAKKTRTPASNKKDKKFQLKVRDWDRQSDHQFLFLYNFTVKG
jgi:hypothetical protein